MLNKYSSTGSAEDETIWAAHMGGTRWSIVDGKLQFSGNGIGHGIVGGYRINPDGTIARWAKTTAVQCKLIDPCPGTARPSI